MATGAARAKALEGVGECHCSALPRVEASCPFAHVDALAKRLAVLLAARQEGKRLHGSAVLHVPIETMGYLSSSHNVHQEAASL